MPARDRPGQRPGTGGNRAAVLGTLALSLGLHSAAFGAFAWFWDATPAQPIAVFAVELIPGDEVGPQPGSRQAEAPEATSEETASTATQAAEAAATETPPPEPLPANSEPRETSQVTAPAPAEVTAETPHLLYLRAAKNMPAETAITPGPAPEAMAEPDPAPDAVRPDPVAAPPEPPPLPLAKPVALRVRPQPATAAQDARPGNLVAEGDTSQTARPETPTPAAVANTGDSSAEAIQVGAATPPRYSGAGLANPAPRYPYLARRRGQEGRVVLRVRVDREGQAAAVSILESSGYHLLDEAALETVRQWRFVPAHKADLTVAGLVDVPVSFRLTD